MKGYIRVVILFIVQCLLFTGCSRGYEKTPVAKKITDKSGPGKVDYSFDGYYAELDGNTFTISPRGIAKQYFPKKSYIKAEQGKFENSFVN